MNMDWRDDREVLDDLKSRVENLTDPVWGVSHNIIKGRAEDVTPKKKTSKEVAGRDPGIDSQIVQMAQQRELAREQRKTMEETYENNRRASLMTEEMNDIERGKKVENAAIAFAAVGFLLAVIGLLLGFENIAWASTPFFGGSIGCAGYKSAIGDRINDRRKQMKRDGFF